MDEKKLDELIERNIKAFSKEIDIARPVIERVAAYEVDRSGTPRSFGIILAVYTAVASLLSIFFFEIAAQSYPTLMTWLSLGVLKSVSQGLLVLILIALAALLFIAPLTRQSQSI